MAEEAKKWNFNATQSVLTVGKKLKLVAKNSKETVEKKNSDPIRKVIYIKKNSVKPKILFSLHIFRHHTWNMT